MYRTLIPVFVTLCFSFLAGWANEEKTVTRTVVVKVPDVASDVAECTSAQLDQLLKLIKENLSSTGGLKDLVDRLGRYGNPGKPVQEEVQKAQELLQQQLQNLEQSRKELEAMAADTRSRAEKLRNEADEVKRLHQIVIKSGDKSPTLFPGNPPMPGMPGMYGMGDGYGGFGTQPEMEMRAIPLKVAVPEKMLDMVNPLVSPGGSFVYDPRNRIVILRGDVQTLDKAEKFLQQLADTYETALASQGIDPNAPQPDELSYSSSSASSSSSSSSSSDSESAVQAVQIESLLLVGEKIPGATTTITQEQMPIEVINFGLTPGDLAPFGRLRLVEVQGPVVLQTAIDPGRTAQATTRLGDYRLMLEITGPRAMVGLKSKEVSLENTIKVAYNRPILVGSVSPETSDLVILVIRFSRVAD